nr:hypothetical protein [uncultured Prevotella sp.]
MLRKAYCRQAASKWQMAQKRVVCVVHMHPRATDWAYLLRCVELAPYQVDLPIRRRCAFFRVCVDKAFQF